MKRSLLRLLPLMAAVTLATSCSKDDDTNAPEKKQNASPQEKTIIYNPDGTITVPFTVKVNTGKSLTKKMEYSEGEDGKINIEFVVGTNDDEKLRVSGEGVTGELGLILSDDAGGAQTYVFSGDLTLSDDVTAADLEKGIDLNYEYGTALTEPASSSESLLALVTNCNHLYKGAASSNVENITLTDQNAYLAISMSPCCKHDIKINNNDFTVEDGRIWIAVPGGKPVESTGLGTELNKAADDVVPSTIHTVARQYFTVKSKKVYFSKGNLQYNPATNEWRFAEHQYDCCVTVNGDITDGNITAWYNTDTKYNGWIDLFGWGMWLDGNGNDPLRIAKDGEYYSTITSSNQYQSLSDNPVIGSEWTTLTAGQPKSNQEWDYLLKNVKFGGGQITNENGLKINGIILLPDDWSLPEGITFNSCTDQNAFSFTANVYDVNKWEKMEANGAVFMPAAGMAKPSDGEVSLLGFNDECRYWSSTAAQNDETSAYIIYAYNKKFFQGNLDRCNGMSVRLVRPL